MCHREMSSVRVDDDSRISFQCAISSGPDGFRPRLNHPTISLRFIFRFAYTEIISVTSFS